MLPRAPSDVFLMKKKNTKSVTDRRDEKKRVGDKILNDEM